MNGVLSSLHVCICIDMTYSFSIEKSYGVLLIYYLKNTALPGLQRGIDTIVKGVAIMSGVWIIFILYSNLNLP